MHQMHVILNNVMSILFQMTQDETELCCCFACRYPLGTLSSITNSVIMWGILEMSANRPWNAWILCIHADTCLILAAEPVEGKKKKDILQEILKRTQFFVPYIFVTGSPPRSKFHFDGRKKCFYFCSFGSKRGVGGRAWIFGQEGIFVWKISSGKIISAKTSRLKFVFRQTI